MTEPVQSSRMSLAWSVIPSGQPKRQNSLFGMVHPVRVATPRRPSAASRASLLPRPTARCLLVLRPVLPDGPPSGSSAESRPTAFTPFTVWGETSRPRSAADHRRRPTGGSQRRRPPAGRARPVAAPRRLESRRVLAAAHPQVAVPARARGGPVRRHLLPRLLAAVEGRGRGRRGQLELRAAVAALRVH